uniref:Putative viridiflorene synthase n=1 Tax=Leonurus sibiricus TaxID=405945 RepID=A0A8F8AJU4_9LAMI|nr:putative viridiflorene synthase [Leonurus sibiricus]
MEEFGSVRDIRPPMNKYVPSVWGDIFSTFSFDDQMQETYEKSIEAGKKEIRSMLRDASSGNLIILLDTIERLGLSYHFETEMKLKLDQIYNFHQDFDLFTTAHRFRLLRQNQYQVSCDVFAKFIGKDNKFEDIHSSDVDGLLSLYEASHVRVDGESVLEEAVAFTTDHLTRLAQVLPEASLSKDKVKQALQHPLHKGVPICNIRRYISIYERDESRIQLLLEIAKINFNFLQNIYKNELCQLSRWWKKFDLKSKLVYARDRIVECYLWGVAANFEPQYSYVRIAYAKSMKLCSVLDDTYDNYATLAEAELFTQHFERWNMDNIDQLPDYMQIVYRFAMSIYEDYQRDATTQDKAFAAPYFQETVKQLCRAYNTEQKWIMERQMPPFEVYINNSVFTSCIYFIFTALIPGIESATKEDIDWLLSEPKIVISIAKMARHLQDLASHETLPVKNLGTARGWAFLPTFLKLQN